MPIVASYTLLNTWAICPHQMYRKYIAKDLPKQPESEPMRWGNAVHKAMEKRLSYGTTLPKEMVRFEPYAAAIIASNDRILNDKPMVEQNWGMTEDGKPCSFFDDGVWLRGKADVALVRDNTAVLFDWKTGKVREDPFELEIQGLLLKVRRPEVKTITGRYVWLAEGRIGVPHDVSDTERTLESVRKTTDEIGHQEKMGYWPKKQGPLCGWCPVKDCEFNRERGK